jgi:hypothetical protein
MSKIRFLFAALIVSALTALVVSALVLPIRMKLGFLDESSRLDREAKAEAVENVSNLCVRSGSPSSVTCFARTIDSNISADREHLVQVEIANWTFGMLITSIVGLVSGLLGLYWIRDTLKATNRSNEIGREALIVSERAWITSEIIQEADLDVEQDGTWFIEVSIRNTNFGKTPALKVHSNIAAATFGKEREELARICRENLSFNEDYGIMLAPGQTFSRPWRWHSARVDEGDEIGNSSKVLVGCITYQTTFDQVQHQTAFVFIVEPDPDVSGKVIFRPWAGSFAN